MYKDHQTNKNHWYKSRKIWLIILIVVGLYVGIGNAISYYVDKNNKKSQKTTTSLSQPAAKTMTDSDIIQMINAERQKVGSNPLSYNGSLVNAASAKANDAKTSGDYSPGTSASIGGYLSSAGYKSDGAYLWVNPITLVWSSSDFVNWIMGSQSTKNILLDGQYKDIGLTITPVNSKGVTSLVTILVAKPYVAPTTVYTPAPTYRPVYTPPTFIHCSSYSIGYTIQTNCF
jgi:hypothetical protein